MSSPLRVRVNGEPRTVAAGTVAELLSAMDRDGDGVAVAVNGSVVPRRAWASRALVDGDRIEVVGAVQGG